MHHHRRVHHRCGGARLRGGVERRGAVRRGMRRGRGPVELRGGAVQVDSIKIRVETAYEFSA